ncbi:hypothetical protein RSal33209_1162 [Renibacterium salmoninarum ATCC 33209]|uniref:Uncharacterized protein n=1 Tax=Renibacterium salmoninarum (strain ATCC 33209 / DSM 20767 / JCM 11484 / NBRC 15589 / NCIMB 2235) TaxID=288705 RepID=A9WPE3_RENSM|nr:hypothetical protein RSal33209_1162 [Renibacterium salmoninarum ATCC 33209]
MAYAIFELISTFPAGVVELNDVKPFTSTTVAEPPVLPLVEALELVFPELPAQALKASAATAAMPAALEIRPKRIPPPISEECVNQDAVILTRQPLPIRQVSCLTLSRA